MSSDIFDFDNSSKKISSTIKQREHIIDLFLRFDGHNEDIMASYYWHVNFSYYIAKGYLPIKIEDYHYFTENSQFGASIRQAKGGAIRAFQENLQQLIQLVKVHMMPLLKELKQAEFYKQWFDKITKNDEKVQELKLKGVKDDNPELNKYRSERNEAINHIKDKWVSEVDGGRLWQINRSSTEQGLDFALLPQLFFGINLDDPFQTKKTLKEQLDEDVYPVDISLGAKEQIARFMYRFYTWLPTAVKDTNVTFRIKVTTLKQFYSQLQMYVDFMKPLLLEISRKTEGFNDESMYQGFDTENPEFVNMFDFSYSFIKIMGVRGIRPDRGGEGIRGLEFTKFGLFINEKEIIAEEFKGKKGFIISEKDETYEFIACDNKNIEKKEFDELKKKWNEKPAYLKKDDMKSYPVMIFDFSQKRRSDMIKTPQGLQQIPFMINGIRYRGYVWNLFEIATYREKLKEDNLNLLSTFIEEIAIIKEDLMHYVKYLESDTRVETQNIDSKKDIKKGASAKTDYTFILGPFQGLGEMFSFLVPNISVNRIKKDRKKGEIEQRDIKHLQNKLFIIEDVWKLYNVHKKTKQYIQY